MAAMAANRLECTKGNGLNQMRETTNVRPKIVAPFRTVKDKYENAERVHVCSIRFNRFLFSPMVWRSFVPRSCALFAVILFKMDMPAN